MKDEKIIEYLKSANLWKNNNLYFFAVCPDSYSKNENIYASILHRIRFLIINKNEDEIGIIPFDSTLACMAECVVRIPLTEIVDVYLEDYKFLFFFNETRCIIKTKVNKTIEFGFSKNKKNINSNISKFVAEYVNRQN